MLTYLHILFCNFMAYFVIIHSYKLKTGRIKAYLSACFCAFLGTAGELMAIAFRGAELYQQNNMLYFAIQGCILSGILLTVVFIRQCLASNWYRIYWWYGVALICLSLSNAVFYNNNAAGGSDTQGFVASLNAHNLLMFLLSLALCIGIGVLLIIISRKISVYNTLSYATKRYRYLIFAFFSLFIWVSKHALMTRNRIIFLYEISACILILIIILAVIIDQSNRKLLKIENTFLNQQKELLSWSYNNMQQRELTIHKLYHDIGNHINTLKFLIEDDELLQAQTYMEDILKIYQEIGENIYCRNHIINAVLMQKRKLSEQNGIDFAASLDLPEQLPFQDMDIMSAFSELLDIMIKACLIDSGKRSYIRLGSKIEGNHLLIEANTNAENINLSENNKRRLSRSLSNESKPYLSEVIINEIIDRLKGETAISHDNGQTTVTLRLPIKQFYIAKDKKWHRYGLENS